MYLCKKCGKEVLPDDAAFEWGVAFCRTCNKMERRRLAGVPRTLKECVQADATAQELRKWAVFVRGIGRVLCGLLLVVGFVFAVLILAGQWSQAPAYASNWGESAVRIFRAFCTGGKYGLCAFSAYIGCRILSWVMDVLADIAQNTKNTARLTAYYVWKDENE